MEIIHFSSLVLSKVNCSLYSFNRFTATAVPFWLSSSCFQSLNPHSCLYVASSQVFLLHLYKMSLIFQLLWNFESEPTSSPSVGWLKCRGTHSWTSSQGKTGQSVMHKDTALYKPNDRILCLTIFISSHLQKIHTENTHRKKTGFVSKDALWICLMYSYFAGCCWAEIKSPLRCWCPLGCWGAQRQSGSAY